MVTAPRQRPSSPPTSWTARSCPLESGPAPLAPRRTSPSNVATTPRTRPKGPPRAVVPPRPTALSLSYGWRPRPFVAGRRPTGFSVALRAPAGAARHKNRGGGGGVMPHPCASTSPARSWWSRAPARVAGRSGRTPLCSRAAPPCAASHGHLNPPPALPRRPWCSPLSLGGFRPSEAPPSPDAPSLGPAACRALEAGCGRRDVGLRAASHRAGRGRSVRRSSTFRTPRALDRMLAAPPGDLASATGRPRPLPAVLDELGTRQKVRQAVSSSTSTRPRSHPPPRVTSTCCGVSCTGLVAGAATPARRPALAQESLVVFWSPPA